MTRIAFISNRTSAHLRERWRKLAYPATFGCIVLAATAALLNSTIDALLVVPFSRTLVTISAALINICGGAVQTTGSVISFVGAKGAVEVSNGCNAIEVSILLAAAILAFPATASSRIIGAVVSVVLLQVFNLFRIISLLYLSRYSTSWFDFFHIYVWDALIVLDALLCFFFWLRWASQTSVSVAS